MHLTEQDLSAYGNAHDDRSSQPDLSRRRSRPGASGSAALAEWPVLPALRRVRERSRAWAARPRRRASAICNACRTKFSVTMGTVFERSPHSAVQVDARLPPDGVEQEGHQRPPAPAHARSEVLQVRVVHGAPHPRGDGASGGSARPARRRRQDRRSRRDRRGRQGEATSASSKRNPKNIGAVGKQIVFTLVERGGVPARSTSPTSPARRSGRSSSSTCSRKSALMTDEAGQYRPIGKEFAGHETVNHGARNTCAATPTATPSRATFRS